MADPDSTTLTPSATTWTRLEPQTRAADLRESAAARIADPAWLLARQWQFGELHASDGGSPASARLRLDAGVMSGMEWGVDGGWRLHPGLPLEVAVERTGASDDLRLRADGGRRFLRLLERHDAGAYRDAFTTTYPLPATRADAPADAEADALLAVLAGRVPDGALLAEALATVVAPGRPPVLPQRPAVDAAHAANVMAAAKEWIRWWRGLVAHPASPSEDAWDPARMEHAFAVGARIGTGTSERPVALTSAEYPGGALDWYDLQADPGTTPFAPAPGRRVTRTVVPTPVQYPGMPASRFWEMEDARVHLGGIEAGATDLGRMLLSEFAILYSDDWFVMPVELPVGTVARVGSLVVTDTFGVQTLIESAAEGDWDMFRVGGVPGEGLFVLPPVLPATMEGPPVEDVLLLRDENANVTWGVERLVESAAGTPIDRHARWLAAVRAAAGRPPDPESWPPDPPGDLTYRLRAGVPPEHWIPFLPEAAPDGLRLRRRELPRDGAGGQTIPPAGELLRASDWVADEEVPRDGVRVVRQWQLARGPGGTTHLWRGRRKLAGRGEAASGLRHDVVERSDPAADGGGTPTIAGVAQVGQAVTVRARTWSGAAPWTLAFQWRRCDATGDVCADIAGATGRTYTPVAADVGARLRIRVVATAPDGEQLVATSPPTDPVVPPPTAPELVRAPTITGRARVGDQLVAGAGTWSGSRPLTVRRRWQRLGPETGFADIAGATSARYRLTADDQGAQVRVVETAVNAAGTTEAPSGATGAVAPPPARPTPTVLPAIAGTARAGTMLEASGGTWAGDTPIALAHRWRHRGATGAGTDVPGATGPTYAVGAADVGLTLEVVVTATNEAGQAEAVSAPTAAVLPAFTVPAATAPPTVTGQAVVGAWLTATPGIWSGPPERLSFQWRRRTGTTVADVPGAVEGTYRLTDDDAGARLSVVVRAVNDAGATSVTAAETEPVLGVARNVVAPTVTGAPFVGQTLTAGRGTWSGTVDEWEHAWWRRRADGVDEALSDADGVHLVTEADIGATLRVQVTARNRAGSTSAESRPTAAVARLTTPANIVPPRIAGAPRTGSELTVEPGEWTGGDVQLSYGWQRGDEQGGGWVQIRNATGPRYVPRTNVVSAQRAAAAIDGTVEEDLGHTLRCVVTATNPAGSATATSAPIGPVTMGGGLPDETM